jgi:hypothetical protein
MSEPELRLHPRRKRPYAHSCAVGGCSSRHGDGSTTRLHKFPLDVNLARQWRNFVDSSMPDHAGSRICSDHFDPTSYINPQGKRLRRGSFPTIIIPPVTSSITTTVSLASAPAVCTVSSAAAPKYRVSATETQTKHLKVK